MPPWLTFVLLHCLGPLLIKKPEAQTRKGESGKQSSLENGCTNSLISRADTDGNRYSGCDGKRSGHRSPICSPEGCPKGLIYLCPRHTKKESAEGILDGIGANSATAPDPITNALLYKQDLIAKDLGQLTKAQAEQGMQEKEKGEWIYIAAVLDKLFLFLFILSVIISGVVIYFKIPKYDEVTE